MSLRTRLALWYGSFLGITVLVACVALYLALQAALDRDFDQILRVRAAQVEREILANISDATDDEESLRLSDIQPDDLEPDALQNFAEPGVYVQVVTIDGQVLATSGTLLPVSSEHILTVQTQQEAFETLAAGDQHIRTLYWPVKADGGPLPSFRSRRRSWYWNRPWRRRAH